MNYLGKWIIAGSWENEKVQDFELQMKKELPEINYEELRKNDIELNQTLEIKSLKEVVFNTTDGEISGCIECIDEKDVLCVDGENIPLNMVDDYLVFNIPGGYVFKRL